jgi:iron complex outermembrane receptor protein
MVSPLATLAQTTEPATEEDLWAGVEEMTVLGNTSEGILAGTGTAVTAFDAGQIEALGIEDVSDLAQFTPNLEIKTAGSTSATLFIRGVGLNDFTANGAGAVAVYQDDVPLNLPAIQLGQIFDVSEVQVLKGPIGTGPGRNASAGAIKIYANKPSGNLAAGIRFDYGNYDFIDSEGHLEVPILEEVLSTRFAYRFTQRDGIIENRCAKLSPAQAANPTACGKLPQQALSPRLSKNLSDRHTWAVRGITRFVPPSDAVDMNWLLGLSLARTDQLGTVGQSFGAFEGRLGGPDVNGYIPREIINEQAAIAETFPPYPGTRQCRRFPNTPGCDSQAKTQAELSRKLAQRPLDQKPFEGDFNRDGFERQTTWGGFLRGDWTIDEITITNITGYEYYTRDREIDADYTPNTLIEFNTNDHAWQATEELNVGGSLEAIPFDWELGGYALFEELDFDQETLQPVGTGIFPIDQTYEQKTRSFAFFGEFTWQLLDDLEFEGGVRYNWEQKEIDADVVVGTSPLCIGSPAGDGPYVCKDVQTVDHPTGEVKLIQTVTEDLTAYLKYTHGWKGLQFNTRDGQVQSGALDVASPEKIDALEWGFSGTWLDDRLNVTGAIFWYDYQDYQVFTFTNALGTPPQRIVVNADDAQLWGAEIETRVEPFERLILDFRFGWLESKFLDFTEVSRRREEVAPGAPPVILQLPADYDGNRLPNTPRFKISFAAQYTFELGRLGSLTPRYDLSWTDDTYFDQSEGRGVVGVLGDDFPDYTIGQKSYALQGVRLTYRTPEGKVEVAGWVRNLTNELYKTTAFNASQGANLVGNLVGDPRTYGLSVSVKY